MKKFKWFFGILFVLATLIGCNEDLLNPDGSLDVPTLKSTTTVFLADGITSIEACGTETVTLWAGQTINAGTVTVSNDATNLYVTINSTAGFQQVADNIKMWVGTDIGFLDGGGLTRPAGGKLPYKVTVTTETSYTFTIPLQDVTGYNAETCGQQTIYVVIHGDVLTEVGNPDSDETAFGGDKTGSGSAWWFYNEYVPSCCITTPPPPTKNLETAFAKPSIQQGGWVFVGGTKTKANPEGYPMLNLTQNRWGWACNLAVAEDIIPPALTFPMYRHWRQSIWDKYEYGIQVLQITNDEENLYVTINYNNKNMWVCTSSTATYNYTSLTYFYKNNTTYSSTSTMTIPLNSIPNFTGFGNSFYIRAGATYGDGSGQWISADGIFQYTPILPVKGTADYPIYAAAGLNNTANGVRVGTAYVQYNGTSLSVKYDLNEGYEMEEVHVYANDAAPLKVAPGQFEFVQYFDPMVNDFETVFDVPDTNADGKIWIILHAVVDLNTN